MAAQYHLVDVVGLAPPAKHRRANKRELGESSIAITRGGCLLCYVGGENCKEFEEKMSQTISLVKL